MLDQIIAQHRSSLFASPTILVRKKDGSWHLRVDFRILYDITIKDRFPFPLIEDLMDELQSATIFSKLDKEIRISSIKNGSMGITRNNMQDSQWTF